MPSSFCVFLGGHRLRPGAAAFWGCRSAVETAAGIQQNAKIVYKLLQNYGAFACILPGGTV